MSRRQVTLASLVPVILGAAVALAMAPSAAEAARRQCEYNACILSTGNCDTVDFPLACREKTGDPGCESSACPAN